MVFLAIIKLFTAIATWFVNLFPEGAPHLTVITGALDDMGFLRLVVPFGTLFSVVGIAVGIMAVVWLITALVWAWKLVKW